MPYCKYELGFLVLCVHSSQLVYNGTHIIKWDKFRAVNLTEKNRREIVNSQQNSDEKTQTWELSSSNL